MSNVWCCALQWRGIVSLMLVWLPTLALAAIPTGEPDPGYRLHDPNATVRVLATIPGESLAQLIVDPSGRLFLGGREAVFVVEPDEVKPGLKPRELYRETGDHWFMGLAVRGDDLYVAKHDAILILSGAVHEREMIQTRTIVWGFPHAKGWAFHQTLHDLKFGPDGKLYFSMGDPAWSFGDFRHPDHWFRTRIETAGTPARRDIVSVGGIFRCDPTDGSNLELVATGTRNNCGFDWNADFDLITTDNDHEQDPRYVPGRLLFVVPGGFYNWPRGWMQDWPENLPALAGLGREVPVGLAIYGDTRFPEDYRGNVLVARWGKQAIDRFVLKREGSSYEAREIPWLSCPAGRRPMAVAVGRGGRIYALVSHMETNAESPTYTADLLEIDVKNGPPGFHPFDSATVTIDRLWTELASPNLSHRMAAHVELTRRGSRAFESLADRMRAVVRPDQPDDLRTLRHEIRLAALAQDGPTRELLVEFLGHPAEDIRYQAVQALLQREGYFDVPLQPLFADPSPRVRRAMLSEAWRLKVRPAPKDLEGVVAAAQSTDPYLRHLGARLLARHICARPGNGDPRGQGTVHDNPFELLLPDSSDGRLATVLADGDFLTIPRSSAPLPDGLELAPSNYEAVGPDGDRRIGLFTIDAWWKALRKTPAQEAAFQRLLKALEDPVPTIRRQALRSLDRLNDPRSIPAVEALVDNAKLADAETLGLALRLLGRLNGTQALDRIVKTFATVDEPAARRAAAEALVALELPTDEQTKALSDTLDRLARSSSLDEATREAAVRRLAAPELLRALALDRQADPQLRASALERLAGVANPEGLRSVLERIEPNAGFRLLSPTTRLVATKLPTATALRMLGTWLESPNEDLRRAAAQAIGSEPRPEFQELALAHLPAETSGTILRPLVQALLSRNLAPPLTDARDDALARLVLEGRGLDLDLRRQVIDHLKATPRYAAIASQAKPAPSSLTSAPAGFTGIDWSTAWKQGDPTRGEAIFNARSGVSCAACHRFQGQGGNNGPSLEEAGKRLSIRYMAESMLNPNAQVAPQYRSWTLGLTSGEVVNGIILQEDRRALTVGLSDGTTRTIPLAEIEERKSASTSIMPEGLLKSPRDLRDILAYLLMSPNH